MLFEIYDYAVIYCFYIGSISISYRQHSPLSQTVKVSVLPKPVRRGI